MIHKNPIQFTCSICPNGCGLLLSADEENSRHYLLRGNRCPRGINFARFQLSDDRDIVINPFIEEERWDHDQLLSRLRNWSSEPFEIMENDFIHGSPERSEYRILVKRNNNEYLLERFNPDQMDRKERLARRMNQLSKGDFPLSPPLKTNNGKFLFRDSIGCWQLTPYLKGKTLNRKNYWNNSCQGEALGRLLGGLTKWTPEFQDDYFDYLDFYSFLISKMEKNQPHLLKRLDPVLHFIEKKILPWFKNWPVSFNHGDPHPLNVLWNEKDGVLALLDWEFSGQKPLMYDPALVMGCVGSEAPQAFKAAFNHSFFQAYKKEASLGESQYSKLPSLCLWIRFAWMNEWLRHEDEEMQFQEIKYMKHLLHMLN